jgi:hypothetical protein
MSIGRGQDPLPRLGARDSRAGAVDAIRGVIEAILLEPDGDRLKIRLKGDVAGMLSAARNSKTSPDTGDLLVQMTLVCAGGPGNAAPKALSLPIKKSPNPAAATK